MKIILLTITILLSIEICSSQNIPFGISQDSIYVYPGVKYILYYYKPLNYDSSSSPILWGIHGQGGNGSSELGNLQGIADRRKALIVSATMHSDWFLGYDLVVSNNCYYFIWLPQIFKKIYKHILDRENRSSISVYMIGFSAGGQCVTRYSLIRQAILDSIPIKMTVSANPFFYSFCTDSLNGIDMSWPCGISSGLYYYYCDSSNYYMLFICIEHIVQYYNENYAVLIGTADTTGASSAIPCIQVQGANRFERAQNFYNFSDIDAVARGTTLKWQYGEVPGVGHDGYLMYNTILAGDSIPLAERLLFETPYHTVPNIAPLANFTVDTTIVTLPNATVQFNNISINATNFLWDFGDTTTSTLFSPSHTYTYADTFTVFLTTISGTGCENKLTKNNYIIVKSGSSITENNTNYGRFKIYPNPSAGNVTIRTDNEAIEYIELYNWLGKSVDIKIIQENKSSCIINSDNLRGMFFIKVKTRENIYNGKIIFR